MISEPKVSSRVMRAYTIMRMAWPAWSAKQGPQGLAAWSSLLEDLPPDDLQGFSGALRGSCGPWSTAPNESPGAGLLLLAHQAGVCPGGLVFGGGVVPIRHQQDQPMLSGDIELDGLHIR